MKKFVQPLIRSLMTSSKLTLGPSALTFNLNLLNIAANNQMNSTFLHSQADREKEEVSSFLAENLKPKPKPKAKNLSGATSSTETIKFKKKWLTHQEKRTKAKITSIIF